jgi:CubicO group peptidase (beta-lactamase class C family)
MDINVAVDRVLEQAVARGDVPGVVAAAADQGGLICEAAAGQREIGADQAMTPNTIFWIASMTKAITSVAAMQLVEQGKLELDAPLGALLPELAEPLVLEGFDDHGQPQLRPARRPITLRHLLTHTSGFCYDTWNADLSRYLERDGGPPPGWRKVSTRRMPLMFDPGDRWHYGIGVDWAGQAVEQASDMLLIDYLREHIFQPLGMADTGFAIQPDRRIRLASQHVRQADGSLAVMPYESPTDVELFTGGGGLYSTGRDYLTFLQMLLHGGTFQEARLLKPETVAEMSRNQIGGLQAGLLQTCNPARSNDANFFPGMSQRWGLGFLINTETAATGRTAGSLAWAGLRNTYYWLDPTRHIAGVLLTQLLPFADPAVLRLLDEFEAAIYAGAGSVES